MTEIILLIVCSVCFGVGGYMFGCVKFLYQLQKVFPDLYEELKRRCC